MVVLTKSTPKTKTMITQCTANSLPHLQDPNPLKHNEFLRNHIPTQPILSHLMPMPPPHNSTKNLAPRFSTLRVSGKESFTKYWLKPLCKDHERLARCESPGLKPLTKTTQKHIYRMQGGPAISKTIPIRLILTPMTPSKIGICCVCLPAVRLVRCQHSFGISKCIWARNNIS